MSAIAFETAGCDTASSEAAFPMLPQRATVMRMFKSRSLR